MSEKISGILKNIGRGRLELRSPARSYRRSGNDPAVPPNMVRKFGLTEGASVEGKAEKKNGRSILTGIDTVCGLKPEEFAKRKSYRDLVAIDPEERFDLSACGVKSMRIVDLVAPIAKGTRGLIVSPPKAGKTMMLQQIANAIEKCNPETKVIVLLVDERPEEVTGFKRSVNAEVLASTIDGSSEEHIELAELMLANIRAELECGRNIVILIDSLTRMARAFNNKTSNRSRTMSGGLSAGAMEIPRKFFGLARNVENGGSITIVATVLVHTGSRMDQLIFEEFKGTGNSEIMLDRYLAEARIYPAIDIPASGTRKEEKLYAADDLRKIGLMRKVLTNFHTRQATESVLKLMNKFDTNEDFLKALSAGG